MTDEQKASDMLGTMTEAQSLLRELVSDHFFGEDLEWSWCEGVTLKEQDRSLFDRIRAALAERTEPKAEPPSGDAVIAQLQAWQDEWDSLLLRWKEARPYSQEVANLDTTFKARERELGVMASAGLFHRLLALLRSTAQAPSGEPLVNLLIECRDYLYNPFESDNQSRLYNKLDVALFNKTNVDQLHVTCPHCGKMIHGTLGRNR